MSDSPSIAIIEDNPAYRDVILLELKNAGYADVLSFSTAEVALDTLENDTKSLPNVIFLDIRLPGMTGLEALTQLKNVSPDSKIILLTRSDDEKNIFEAIEKGADGYLLKSTSLQQIGDSIKLVLEGKASLDPRVAKFILNSMSGAKPKPEENVLTDRELDVLKLLAEGQAKKNISSNLGVSYDTVDFHVRNIYNKLQAPNAPAAINKAHQRGLL